MTAPPETARSQTAPEQDVATDPLSPAEADHQIANSLSLVAVMLRHQSKTVADAEGARIAMASASLRVQAIARMHRLLTEARPGKLVDFESFLRPVCDTVAESLDCRITLASDPAAMSEVEVAKLGIVINELATNAVKHARSSEKPPQIAIEARRLGTRHLRLTLQDDGFGLPEDFDIERTRGLGMKIVTTTISELGGSVHVAPGDGAVFVIDLPLTTGG